MTDIVQVDHHPADNALHMDVDVDEGTPQHFHADTGASGNGLLTTAEQRLPKAKSMRLPDFARNLWLSPTLEGLLRPPPHIA